VLRVDPAHNAFAYEMHGQQVTGTFEGDPWSWTAFTERGTVAGSAMTAEGKLVGDTLVLIRKLERRGLPGGSMRSESKAFDCRELDHRRAALDDTAPDATHFCYDGTEKTLLGSTEHVVYEQIVEPRRIRIVRYGPQAAAVHIYSVDGAKIEVTNPMRPGLHGTGTLTGAPGAWTGFSWKTDVAPTLAVTGSLGGPTLTLAMTPDAPRAQSGSVEAIAFDCRDLAKHTP
jgi:hypothetical protein